MTPPTSAPSRTPVARLWVGTYPAAGPEAPGDAGEGVWRLDVDLSTGRIDGGLAVRTPAPSFVVAGAGGRVLYAAGETADGTLSVLDVSPDGALTERHAVGSGGASPCHLLVHPRGRALYVSNYMSGTVAVLPLTPDGGLAPEVLAGGGPTQVLGHAGSGPRTDRQEGPHAHSSLLAPGGQHLLVADLGTDELRRYRVADDGSLTDDGIAHRFPAGTGPRHAAVGPAGHLYVVGELTATVHVLAWDAAAGTAREVQVLPACAAPVASGTHRYPAHVVLDGDRLLVSVRGADVLAAFAVHDDGRLEHLGDVPVGGGWPRHFDLVPGWAVVAAQNAGQVTTLPWDGRALGDVAGRLDVPFPACVLPG